MRKVLAWLAAISLALLATAGAVSTWLLYSESGARWLFARAEQALAPGLSAASVAGSLRDGVALPGLRIAAGGSDLRIERLAFVVDPDLFGPGITVRGLRGQGVVVVLPPAGDTADSGPPRGGALRLRDLLATLSLPVSVAVDDLLVERIAVRAADDSPIATVDRVSLTAALGDAIVIDEFAIGSPSGNLSLSGTLDLGPPFALAADLTADGGDPLAAGWLPAAGQVTASGTLDELHVTIGASEPAIRIAGTIADVDTRPVFDLAVSAPRLPRSADYASAPVIVRDVNGAVTGTLDDYRAVLRAVVEARGVAPITADATLAGDLAGLRVERLTADSSELAATATGRLGWRDGLSAAADAAIDRLDPGRWLDDWPDGESLGGELHVALDGERLDVGRLALRHGNARVEGSGLVDLAAGVVDVDLQWRNLRWPLTGDAPRVTSRDAALAVSGAPDDWRLAGDVAMAGAGLPAGSFSLAGEGSRRRADLTIREGRVLGGIVTGAATVGLDDGVQWTASLDARNVRTDPLLPDWPGRISADLDASGSTQPFALTVDIETLRGELRARPIAAAGRVDYRDDKPVFDGLSVRSGGSSLTLDGDWESADGVAVEVAIDTLADFIPDATGSVQGRARLRAAQPLPVVDASFTAAEVAWRGWSARSVTLGNAPDAAAAPLALDLEIDGLQFGERRAEHLAVTLDGSLDRHELAASVSGPDGEASLAIAGGLADPERPLAAGWSGDLTGMSLGTADETSLSLRDSVPLAIGGDGVELADACLDAGSGGALCLGGDWSPDGRYRARFEFASLPLDLLRVAAGGEFQFTQRLDGRLALAAEAGGKPTGEGRIDISAGEFRDPRDPRLTLATRDGFAAFDLEAGQLLSAEISLPFSATAEIAGSFLVEDVARGGASPIVGRLTASMRDLGVAARLLPQIDDAAGRLTADVSVDGTLGAPRFDGGLALENGRIAYDPLGLEIEDIQLESRILPGNRVELDARFRAGDGRGRLTSSTDYLEGQSGGFEVALAGSDLTVIDLDDLRVTISPDMEVGLRNGVVQLSGQVAVPSARLASVKFINTGVSESEDVVIVGSRQPAEEAPAAAESPLEWYGNMVLELGNDVKIDLDVAQASMTGQATYYWRGPALPQASGGFQVGGKFEAYGQLLEITEGAIRYPHVDASNPQLRIRAERDIFGNSQVRRAGVLVTGTALKPNLEVYTTPATSQDRALTLLATGSDFNYEQGVGAVDVGTYIAPDLYVSYGIGLFDRDNVISVRYDLAQGFGIKASSGKRAAGVDLSYTIER